MKAQKTGYITGYSTSSIKTAIENALEQAGKPTKYKIIETSSNRYKDKTQYKVVLSTINEVHAEAQA